MRIPYELMERRRKRFLTARILILLFFLCGSGCRPSYLFHVAKGEIALLNGAVPIKEALDKAPFTDEQKKKLLLVRRVKTFGETDLGLKKTDNYETVYPHSDLKPLYFVSASEKDRFLLKTWWFPIVGDLPYLGFFDVIEARKEQTRLLDQDLDVYLGRAGAYSTLGWFRDPVPMNLIEGSTEELVNTLLHEMTHVTLYVDGQGAFNEGLAVLVGTVGALRFFEKHFGPSHPLTEKARNEVADERVFSRFLNELMDELENLYALQMNRDEILSLRAEVFAKCLNRFDDLKKEFKTRRFDHFGVMPVNNAYLMTVSLYHRHFDLFEAVLNQNEGSIKKMLQYLKDFSRREGDLVEQLRRVMAETGDSEF